MAKTDTSPAALRALVEESWGRPQLAGWMHRACLALRAVAAEKDETTRLMADPNAVHLNTLRGTIAKPTIDQIVHLYGREALLTALAAEKEAGAAAPAQGPLTEVGETSRGYKLYRAPNPVGGNTYWSDEIGGGVVVWDTCLVGEETLRLALAIESGAPALDGWIPWEGGRMPVSADQMVRVKCRNGREIEGSADKFWWWNTCYRDDDIISYRIAKEGTP